MTQLLSILLLAALPHVTDVQTPPDNQIRYDQNKALTWDDFTKRIRPNAVYKAFTYSGISFSVATVAGKVELDVYTYFDTKESWVEKDHQKPELLNHEQRHFDITELWTRKMKEELKAWDGMDVRAFLGREGDKKTQEIYDRLYEKMEEEQRRYDRETDHGTIKEQQVKWDLDIAGRLELK